MSIDNRIPITAEIFGDGLTGTFSDADGALVYPNVGVPALLDLILEREGMTSAALARYLEVDPRQVRRWKAREDVPQPAMRRRLLELWVDKDDAKPSAENPLILATIVAGLMVKDNLPSVTSAQQREVAIADARKWARAIDEGVAAERRLRAADRAGV